MEQYTLIIAICSLVVSITAIVISIWQNYITRQHNIVSVKPLLRLSHDHSPTERIITLNNYGLGPAIIKNISMINSQKEEVVLDANVWEEFLVSIGYRGPVVYFFVKGSFAIDKGEEKVLVKLVNNKKSTAPFRDIIEKIDQVSFKITFNNMYNDVFVYSSDLMNS